MKRKNKKSKKQYLGRDLLFVKLRQGATKAGIHKDRKKEKAKYLAREDVDFCDECDFANCDDCSFYDDEE